MTRRLVWIALSFLGLALAAPSPNAFPLEKPFTVNINLTGRETAQLRFDPNKKQLVVRVRGKTQFLEITTIDDTERGNVLVNDYNFDGFADIAIPDGIGYGGVNYFYALYVFAPSRSRFERLEFPGSTDLCNPELRVRTRTIETDCKSGPKYEFADYRFTNGLPYVYRTAEMIVLDGFDTDQYLVYNVSVFNPSAERLRLSISDDPRLETAPLRYVPVPRAFLYDAPSADAITRNYLVRGDAVRILDVRDTDSGQWLKVAYQSRKLGRIIKWVSL
jgi:hypothetical protein